MSNIMDLREFFVCRECSLVKSRYCGPFVSDERPSQLPTPNCSNCGKMMEPYSIRELKETEALVKRVFTDLTNKDGSK